MRYYTDDPQEGTDSEHSVRDMLKIGGIMWALGALFAFVMTWLGGGF